jgi:uncharacterized protein DUF3658
MPARIAHRLFAERPKVFRHRLERCGRREGSGATARSDEALIRVGLAVIRMTRTPPRPYAVDNMFDALILSTTSDRWQNVAKIITVVSDRVEGGPHFDAIAARIRALVDEGKLEAKGDISRWRYSEVRRPQSSSAKEKA